MNVQDMFSSKYLKAEDLRGMMINLTISHVEVEDTGSADRPNHRPVVYFMGKKKGLPLNKTNATTIIQAYGPETDNWQGCEITLFDMLVDYQGKPTKGIRIRIPSRPVAPPAQQPVAAQPSPTGSGVAMATPATGAAIEDEIPF